MSAKISNSKIPAVAQTPPERKGMGTKGKLLLAAGGAVLTVAATEIALRKFTKTGGIIPNLRRLGKEGKKFLNKKDGLVSKVRRFAKKGKKMLGKKGKK